jgi:FGGY-family pentulose kinase
MKCFLGIDVGTGSARAGLFTATGRMLASASVAIKLWRPAPDFAEQSSDDIWQACCTATKRALRRSGVAGRDVAGVGFDATCSLVALDAGDRPVSLSPTGRRAQNVIVWMDHRAIPQAGRINRCRHEVLRYVGGVISPEMQLPKLLWIRENLPAAWKNTARFLDLPDYLTYRATGDDTRSLCTTVCKWAYLGHEGFDGAGWRPDFFRAIGLGQLADEGFRRIGTRIRPMGEPLAGGLSAAAARQLGLEQKTPVGVSIIDAHAGGLGLLGARMGMRAPSLRDFNRRLALIGGTSSCHMAVSPRPRYVPGVWGPYHSAMVPGLWLTEGGQTATGALIDHVIQTHAAAPSARVAARKQGLTVYEYLNRRLEGLARERRLADVALLTGALHVQPDFHGNRSPRADPTLRGTVTGLGLSAGVDDLAVLYLAAIQAVAYGTRHILDELRRAGYRIDTLLTCGGGIKNRVFVRQHADITGCRVVLPREPEAVLLGSALLGAVAAGAHRDIPAAMAAMNTASSILRPRTGALARYHARKYRVFHRLHADFLSYRRLMAGAL